MLIEKDYNNTTAWKIDNQEKLLTKINKNVNEVLIIILNMHIIHIKYLNQANDIDKK